MRDKDVFDQVLIYHTDYVAAHDVSFIVFFSFADKKGLMH